MTKPLLTQERVLSLFEYRDGVLIWKPRPLSDFVSTRGFRIWNTKFAGKVAGSRKAVYAIVAIDAVNYLQHRVIFLMHHGYVPEFLDHIDHDCKNNRVENLRPADKSQNNMNRPVQKNSPSGHKNVHWNKQHGKWMVRVQKNQAVVFGGLFSSVEAAAERAAQLRGQVHEQFARG
jgi:hypothetical protein